MIGKLRFLFTLIIFFIFSLVFLFIVLFNPFNPNNTYIMSKVGRNLFLTLLGIKLEVENKEGLERDGQYIYIGNHQTILDVIIYGTLCPKRTIVLGKKEIAFIPIFGQLFWLLGHCLVDRKNHDKAIDTMVKLKNKILKNGASVLIMPEGTRRYKKGLGEFKKGAFRLAIDTKFPIIPIIVETSANDVDYSRLVSAYVRVKVLEPIVTDNIKVDEIDDFILKIRDIYQKELESFSS